MRNNFYCFPVKGMKNSYKKTKSIIQIIKEKFKGIEKPSEDISKFFIPQKVSFNSLIVTKETLENDFNSNTSRVVKTTWQMMVDKKINYKQKIIFLNDESRIILNSKIMPHIGSIIPYNDNFSFLINASSREKLTIDGKTVRNTLLYDDIGHIEFAKPLENISKIYLIENKHIGEFYKIEPINMIQNLSLKSEKIPHAWIKASLHAFVSAMCQEKNNLEIRMLSPIVKNMSEDINIMHLSINENESAGQIKLYVENTYNLVDLSKIEHKGMFNNELKLLCSLYRNNEIISYNEEIQKFANNIVNENIIGESNILDAFLKKI